MPVRSKLITSDTVHMANDDRRDPDSPSTSYKSSLHTPEVQDELPGLTFVNPCHGAPAPIAELQPFSSRQSRNTYQADNDGRPAGNDWPAIEEQHGDAEKGVGPDGEQDVESDIPVLSKSRMFLIASGMLLTYFLGVSRCVYNDTERALTSVDCFICFGHVDDPGHCTKS